MIKLKRVLTASLASLLALSSLTACSIMTEEQKEVVDAYIKKKTPDEMLQLAQTELGGANYLNMQVNYSFNYIDKDVAQGIQQQGADYSVHAIKGHGYWKGSNKTEDGTITKEEAYVIPTDEVKQSDGSNAIDDIAEKYTKFYSMDSGETWDKEGSENIWGTKVITSMDYTKLTGCEGLTLDKGQDLINGIYAYHLHGTVSYEKGKEFIGSLTELLNMQLSPKIKGAENVSIDMYFYQDGKPFMTSVIFNDIANEANSNFTYSTWEIQAQYKDYNKVTGIDVPSRIRLEVLEKARQKQQEENFNLGGIDVELPTEETQKEDSNVEVSVDENGIKTQTTTLKNEDGTITKNIVVTDAEGKELSNEVVTETVSEAQSTGAEATTEGETATTQAEVTQ